MGTGFFVSPDGLFVTARHVLFDDRTGTSRVGLANGWLTKELRSFGGERYYHPFSVVYEDAAIDIAVLRVSFAEQQRRRPWLAGESGFPFIRVSSRVLDEGEPVYSFGYPLSEAKLNILPDGTTVGAATTLHPRVTSAIVASSLEASGIVTSVPAPSMYVLDKALNYGNSGGPIVAEETGCVHAVCTRFQPVRMVQPQLASAGSPSPFIYIPSLYGIVSPLHDVGLLAFLESERVAINDE